MATDRLKKKIGKGRHRSVIKRDRQSKKRRLRNRDALSDMKTAIKNVRTALSAEILKKTIPIVARAAKKGIIHKRKAARLISRLTKAVSSH